MTCARSWLSAFHGMYPVRRKNQCHHPHLTEVETEAQRCFTVAEPGVCLALDHCSICDVVSRNHPWDLAQCCTERHTGCQQVRGFLGSGGFRESLAGETAVGGLCEAVRRMLPTALSAQHTHEGPVPFIIGADDPKCTERGNGEQPSCHSTF